MKQEKLKDFLKPLSVVWEYKTKQNPLKQKSLLKTMEMEGKIQKNSRFKRVCVFCGSSTGKRNCYSDAAIDLAHELVPLSPIHKQYSRLNTFFFSLTLCTFFSFFLVCAKVARRLDLVYGGGSIGLMGLVSKAVHHGGGNVIG